ncbi:MAG: AAA family ATPase [Vagococcus sp.]
MKIVSLHIKGFGKFQQQVFELDSENQLIYGDNESGKSTLYHFIRTVLFGFPKKREMVRDFTPVHGAVYGGHVILEHDVYGTITVERFKDKQKGQATVHLEDGRVGHDALLESLIHPLNQETFDQIFSFQQEQLTDLNQLNEVKLQHLLLSVGLTGSERLTKMNDGFLKERQRVFKPTGRIPVLNQKLKGFKKLEKQIQDVEEQEGTYQHKKERHSELKTAFKEMEFESEALLKEEQRLIEQQKRFSLYVEWETLRKEFGSEKKASDSLLRSVKESMQEYRFLESKEKQLLEKQGSVAETESPAFLFYLENQSLFDELLEDQLIVESMSERRDILERQLEDYRQNKATLYDKYQLTDAILEMKVTDEIESEMQKISIEEEELIREKIILSNEKSRLSIKHREMDTALTTTEQQLAVQDTDAEDERSADKRTTMRLFSGLSIAVSVLFFIMAVALGKGWLYLPTVALVGLGVYGFLRTTDKGKGTTTSPVTKENYLLQLGESDDLARELHELEQSQESIELKLSVIQQQKVEWATIYGFSVKETISMWLTKLPVFEQLLTIHEKETEMLSNLKEVDKVLASYTNLLDFSKEWLAVENKSTRESFQVMKRFVDEQQIKLRNQGELESNHRHFQTQLRDIRQQMEHSKQGLLALLVAFDIARLENVPIWLSKQESLIANQQRFNELQLMLEDYYDLSQTYQLIAINQELMRVKDKQDDLKQLVKDSQKNYQKLAYELQLMEKNGSLDDLYQERENQLATIKQLTNQWLSYRMAEELTQDLFQFLSDQQLPALLATVTTYFRVLTEESYQKVIVKQGQLLVKDHHQQEWPIVQLSTGTKDQLYIAFRLGFIHLHNEDYGAPVVIDDGWLHFDSKRKETLFRLLELIGKQTQVICLSSDDVMLSYFKGHHQAILSLEGMETT